MTAEYLSALRERIQESRRAAVAQFREHERPDALLSELRRIVDASVPTVGPDDLLTDIVETAVGATVPLAVVDAERRLIGVIPRVTLLAALGNVPATTREMPIIQTPIDMVAEFTPLVDAAAEGGER